VRAVEANVRSLPIVAVMLLCAGCQPYAGGVVAGPGDLQTSQARPSCRQFAAPVTTGGAPEQVSGQACLQPDGSWRVVQNTPGLPT
jgi:surface antigen